VLYKMKRFLVVGDANVDIIVSGINGFPVLGQELSCESFSMHLGGSSANSASCLAGLGADVSFWGKVGADAFGDFVLREFQQRHIDTGNVIQDSLIHTGACVALSYSSDRALISYLVSIASLQFQDFPIDLLGEFDHLHSGSIFIQEGLKPDFVRLFKMAKEHSLTTSLDSGWDPAGRWQIDFQSLLPFVDYFLPNEAEALHITGKGSIEDAIEELGKCGSTIIVKRGERGALARAGNQVWQASAFEIDAVETTGAGDCFNAGLLYALIENGQEISAALQFANGCGAIGASTPGGASARLTSEEVHRFIFERLGHLS
jgi:sugar/nucleoside kinase (ribokinase family)